MAKANLGNRAPDAIDWYNTGIPTNAEAIDHENLINVEGSVSEGLEIGNQGVGTSVPTTDLGPGPQGNMFGMSSHESAQATIAASEAFAGPDNTVLVRPDLLPVEAVEGFGTPDVGVDYIIPAQTRTVS